MGIYVNDLRELVIRPVLQQLNEWSLAAENLLLGTAAHESQMAFRLQNTQSTCLGIYRISPAAHIQLWDQYLIAYPELASSLRGFASQQQFLRFPHNELISNLSYATGVAWIIYKSNDLQLPDENDVYGLAHCWLDHYSCHHQHKSMQYLNQQPDVEKFVADYRKLVLRENKKIAA